MSSMISQKLIAEDAEHYAIDVFAFAEVMAALHAFAAIPGLFKRTNATGIRCVDAGKRAAQVEDVECVLSGQADCARAISLTPTVLLTDQQSDIGRAVNPVDPADFDVANVSIAIGRDDRKRHTFPVSRGARQEAAESIRGRRIESALEETRHLWIVHPSEIWAIGVLRTQPAQSNAAVARKRHAASARTSTPATRMNARALIGL